MSLKRVLKIIFGKVFAYGLCVLLQVLWLAGLIISLSEYYIPLTIIMEVIGILLVLNVITTRDNPAYKLVWTVVILVFPLFGVFLYMFIGQSKVFKVKNRAFTGINQRFNKYKADDAAIIERLDKENTYVKNQISYLTNYSGYGAYGNTDINFLSNTQIAYDALLEELEKAEKFIFMEYFAFEDGEAFRKIEDILFRKAAEGIDVRIIYDDFGSSGYINSKFRKKLQANGVQVRAFNPIIPLFYIFMNSRDHRKITVIDGKVSFNGGFNMCDEYFNINCPYGYWKDSGIMLKGDAVRNHTIMFLQMWNCIRDTDKDYDKYLIDSYDINSYNAQDSDAVVLPFSDSPLDNECVGENAYINIIRSAKKYVYIYTPYLIIDNEMMEILCIAAKSGIDVRIVTPGIPDKKIIYTVTKSYYPQLIDAGVKIYHFTPGFIHSKCFICDDEVAIVGSINMDFRSLYLHFECGTYIYKSSAIHDIKEDFMETFIKSEQVLNQDMRKTKSTLVKVLHAILKLFAPLM